MRCIWAPDHSFCPFLVYCLLEVLVHAAVQNCTSHTSEKRHTTTTNNKGGRLRENFINRTLAVAGLQMWACPFQASSTTAGRHSEILNPHLRFLHRPRIFKVKESLFRLTRLPRTLVNNRGRINLSGATRASHPACKQHLGEAKSRVSSLKARS